jgi:hypothetical protein
VSIDPNVVDLAWTVLGSALFALIGFVWKISHRVSELASRVESLEATARRDRAELQKQIDGLVDNLDKNREWTTSRMMSIHRDIRDS